MILIYKTVLEVNGQKSEYGTRLAPLMAQQDLSFEKLIIIILGT